VILVDTSVWIDHFRSAEPKLVGLLLEPRVMSHPYVVGELACGGLKRRAEVVRLLRSLPAASVADADDVLTFIESHALAGTGLGWIDVNLLASARLAGARLWTRDRKLTQAASRLDVDY
jgi:predicted nucleic acid-binding protein